MHISKFETLYNSVVCVDANIKGLFPDNRPFMRRFIFGTGKIPYRILENEIIEDDFKGCKIFLSFRSEEAKKVFNLNHSNIYENKNKINYCDLKPTDKIYMCHWSSLPMAHIPKNISKTRDFEHANYIVSNPEKLLDFLNVNNSYSKFVRYSKYTMKKAIPYSLYYNKFTKDIILDDNYTSAAPPLDYTPLGLVSCSFIGKQDIQKLHSAAYIVSGLADNKLITDYCFRGAIINDSKVTITEDDFPSIIKLLFSEEKELQYLAIKTLAAKNITICASVVRILFYLARDIIYENSSIRNSVDFKNICNEIALDTYELYRNVYGNDVGLINSTSTFIDKHIVECNKSLAFRIIREAAVAKLNRQINSYNKIDGINIISTLK